MKLIMTLLLAALTAGGDREYDSRLNGTWRSNRDETVATEFKRDPRWTNAPPEKIERFRDMFGRMTITYSNEVITTDFKGGPTTFRYKVVNRGDQFVVIRTRGGILDDRNWRIDFTKDRGGYWIDFGAFGIREKFDRISAQPIGSASAASSQP